MIRIVLIRPKRAENIGAIARAMKNFAFSDWVAVASEEVDREAARLVATQSHDMVDSLRVVGTLDEAVADCVWVVGTTSRTRKGMRRLEPREAATEAIERAVEGPVAFVFGDESSGLNNELLDRVHDVSAILTDAAQPSVNLAQSVLLYLYELNLARRAKGAVRVSPLPQAASDRALEQLTGSLESLLTESGFRREGGADVARELMASLRRGRLSRREAGLWSAALASLAKQR